MYGCLVCVGGTNSVIEFQDEEGKQIRRAKTPQTGRHEMSRKKMRLDVCD
jgi:hypothetical protein